MLNHTVSVVRSFIAHSVSSGSDVLVCLCLRLCLCLYLFAYSCVPTPSAPAEVSVSPASLTFPVANWASAQQLAVTGEDDDVTDGDVEVLVELVTASSDAEYNGVLVVSRQ